MKNRVSFLLLLFAPMLAHPQTGAQQPVAPNLYSLSGGHLHIGYSTTSIEGQPRFAYNDGAQTVSFRGSQIRQTKTEIGTLVSVTIRMTVDSGSTTFTTLLPAVDLGPQHPPAQIRACGITTVHKFSVAPAANQGQKETYTTTELSGTASLVFF